ncbi:MAG: SPFH domain-containing protein, partial [Anaerolineales bacterium]|nr:SPFH domain-containing protein [Anaerolineales bacterium]
MKNISNFFSSGLWRILIIGFFVLVIGIPLVLVFTSQFAYILERVEPQEVGVRFQAGQIKDIVGPGVYSDFGLYVEIRRVSSQAIPFNVRDEEIITKDKQRIGLVVTGDALRPGIARKDVLLANWAQYSQLYLDDGVAQERVKALAQQAMKVCVGERPFDDAIIGTARDELRNCIDEEVSKLAEIYGLVIQNVVVPEVVLSPEVQTALDAIVQSRLETEKAAQDKLRADAQAQAEQARQEGEIRVEQSRIQE